MHILNITAATTRTTEPTLTAYDKQHGDPQVLFSFIELTGFGGKKDFFRDGRNELVHGQRKCLS